MDYKADLTEEVKQVQEERERALRQVDRGEAVPQFDVLQMHKELRSWAVTLLVLGAVQIFAGGILDPVWGVLLIAIAILAWRIKLPAMFVLYSVAMAWAALMNGLSVLMGASVLWLVLALLQVYWTVSILKRWRKYSRLSMQELKEMGAWPAHLAPPQPETVITGRFAIAGLVLAVAVLLLLPSIFVGGVALLVITGTSEPPSILIWLLEGAIDIAVLALGLSCAAVLSKNSRKGWAVGGVIVSALVLLGWLIFLLISLLVIGFNGSGIENYRVG